MITRLGTCRALATAAAYVETTHGPIIAILHQGAAMHDGKTILSPGQLEHFGCQVFDRPKCVTGVHPYMSTPCGRMVPMAMQHGLPYVNFRPPTDSELEDLSIPRVVLTSPHNWNPACLDSEPPDNWFDI